MRRARKKAAKKRVARKGARKAARKRASRKSRRPGPGEYLPDPTEGVTRLEDLPKPKIVEKSRDYRKRPCPFCGHKANRDGRRKRKLHDLGDMVTSFPRLPPTPEP